MDYFNNDNIVREVNTPYEFNEWLSEYNKQDLTDAHTHMLNIYQKLMDKYIIK